MNSFYYILTNGIIALTPLLLRWNNIAIDNLDFIILILFYLVAFTLVSLKYYSKIGIRTVLIQLVIMTVLNIIMLNFNPLSTVLTANFSVFVLLLYMKKKS